jgi:hypothetical protein|tara:strand:+ start:905 stop:1417 length:513 start_codon:yes stop_codon:yes gene_type:complete
MLNGYGGYELLKIEGSITEKQMKLSFAEKVKSNKEKLKYHKLETLSVIEENLLYEDEINIFIMLCLCIVECLNVVVISNNIAYKLQCCDDNLFFVVRRIKETYVLETSKISDFHDKIHWVENIKKPLKAISSYKLEDLKIIATAMNVDVCKKTKNVIYEILLQLMTFPKK